MTPGINPDRRVRRASFLPRDSRICAGTTVSVLTSKLLSASPCGHEFPLQWPDRGLRVSGGAPTLSSAHVHCNPTRLPLYELGCCREELSAFSLLVSALG